MAAQRLERELVLQSYLDPEAKSSSPISSHRPQASRPARDLTKEEQTANASSDVTLALRRTHDLMAGELSRSQFAHETLKESTAVLERLGETYGTLDTMLSASRNLLSTLISSQKSDTWYLETAFMVLSVTIGWLVFRRFIYGPAWWLIWLPLKLAYKSMMGVFAAAGLARGISSEQAVSVSSSLTHIHTSIPSNSQSSIVPPVEEPVSNGEQSSESISARVGKIIDGDELPPHEKNPKKRVWEEPVEGDTLIKDEL